MVLTELQTVVGRFATQKRKQDWDVLKEPTTIDHNLRAHLHAFLQSDSLQQEQPMAGSPASAGVPHVAQPEIGRRNQPFSFSLCAFVPLEYQRHSIFLEDEQSKVDKS